MNSFERMTRRLKGEKVDRLPNFNIYMTFAAQYISQPLSKYYLDYRVLADSNMAMVENFSVDILQAISDPYRETYDFGAKIEFPDNDMPLCKTPLLENPDDLSTLLKPDPASGKRMSDRLEAIRLMCEKSNNEIPVMGWVEGALAEAGDLRGISNVMLDLLERPGWLMELLELVTEVEINFAKAQLEAGAHMIGLGDAIASQISPDMYEEYALPFEKRIFDAVHNMGGLARLHICGDTTALIPQMVESGADIIDLDWMVDMKAISEQYGDRISFCGNIDPVEVLLNGSVDKVRQATQECVKVSGNRSIMAAGCEIPLGTPQENLHAQADVLKKMGPNR